MAILRRRRRSNVIGSRRVFRVRSAEGAHYDGPGVTEGYAAMLRALLEKR